LTPNQKLLNPPTKICKFYGVGVKLTIEDSLKENPKGRKLSTDLSRAVGEKIKNNN